MSSLWASNWLGKGRAVCGEVENYKLGARWALWIRFKNPFFRTMSSWLLAESWAIHDWGGIKILLVCLNLVSG